MSEKVRTQKEYKKEMGKEAIWRGKETKDFIDWKKKKNLKNIKDLNFSLLSEIELNRFMKELPFLCYGLDRLSEKEIPNAIEHRLKRKNVFKGGLGDNLNSSDVILKELDMGIKVEFEHVGYPSKRMQMRTINRLIFGSMDIAFDHLAEIPDYYTRLNKLEDIAESFWDNKNWKINIEKINIQLFKRIIN